MKRIIILLLAAMAYFLQAFGQEKETVTPEESGKTETTTRSAKQNTPKGDTVVVTEWEDIASEAPAGTKPKKVVSETDSKEDTFTFFDNEELAIKFDKGPKNGLRLAAMAILITFAFPLLVIFIVFYFRYKNKKAKYKLIQQAIESGQPLPEEFVKAAQSNPNKKIRAKGINNVFTGIGLFIFLWAITGSFSIGAVGILVLFIGFGQLVISYTQDSDEK